MPSSSKLKTRSSWIEGEQMPLESFGVSVNSTRKNKQEKKATVVTEPVAGRKRKGDSVEHSLKKRPRANVEGRMDTVEPKEIARMPSRAAASSKTAGERRSRMSLGDITVSHQDMGWQNVGRNMEPGHSKTDQLSMKLRSSRKSQPSPVRPDEDVIDVDAWVDSTSAQMEKTTLSPVSNAVSQISGRRAPAPIPGSFALPTPPSSTTVHHRNRYISPPSSTAEHHGLEFNKVTERIGPDSLPSSSTPVKFGAEVSRPLHSSAQKNYPTPVTGRSQRTALSTFTKPTNDSRLFIDSPEECGFQERRTSYDLSDISFKAYLPLPPTADSSVSLPDSEILQNPVCDLEEVPSSQSQYLPLIPSPTRRRSSFFPSLTNHASRSLSLTDVGDQCPSASGSELEVPSSQSQYLSLAHSTIRQRCSQLPTVPAFDHKEVIATSQDDEIELSEYMSPRKITPSPLQKPSNSVKTSNSGEDIPSWEHNHSSGSTPVKRPIRDIRSQTETQLSADLHSSPIRVPDKLSIPSTSPNPNLACSDPAPLRDNCRVVGQIDQESNWLGGSAVIPCSINECTAVSMPEDEIKDGDRMADSTIVQRGRTLANVNFFSQAKSTDEEASPVNSALSGDATIIDPDPIPSQSSVTEPDIDDENSPMLTAKVQARTCASSRDAVRSGSLLVRDFNSQSSVIQATTQSSVTQADSDDEDPFDLTINSRWNVMTSGRTPSKNTSQSLNAQSSVTQPGSGDEDLSALTINARTAMDLARRLPFHERSQTFNMQSSVTQPDSDDEDLPALAINARTSLDLARRLPFHERSQTFNTQSSVTQPDPDYEHPPAFLVNAGAAMAPVERPSLHELSQPFNTQSSVTQADSDEEEPSAFVSNPRAVIVPAERLQDDTQSSVTLPDPDDEFRSQMVAETQTSQSAHRMQDSYSWSDGSMPSVVKDFLEMVQGDGSYPDDFHESWK